MVEGMVEGQRTLRPSFLKLHAFDASCFTVTLLDDAVRAGGAAAAGADMIGCGGPEGWV